MAEKNNTKEKIIPKHFICLGGNEKEHDYIFVEKFNEESDYIELDENDQDIADISRIIQIKQESKDIEEVAKYYAYQLDPIEKHRDYELQAKGARSDLNEKGYSINNISTPEMQSHGIFIYALSTPNPADPLTVICRGTKADASIIADLDLQGPGYSQIAANREHIRTQINALLGNRTSIIVAGHSLGAALSQYVAADMVAAKKETLDGARQADNISKLKNIDMKLFQAPGISAEQAQQATDCLKAVKASQQDFSLTTHMHICDKDIVSKAGVHLYADAEPELAEVYLDYREYNKSIFSIGSTVLSAGYSASLSAGSMLLSTGAAIVTGGVILKSQEIVESHTTYFNYKKDENNYLVEQQDVYGLYSNLTPEGKSKIQEISSRDIFNTSVVKGAQELVFSNIKDVVNDEISYLKKCMDSGKKLANNPIIKPVICNAWSKAKGCMLQAKDYVASLYNKANY